MEREDYENRIKDLLGAVQTLLDSNKSLGEKLEKTSTQLDHANLQIETMRGYISSLESKVQVLEGKNAAHNRNRFSGHRDKATPDDSSLGKGKTKEQEEAEYIESEGKMEAHESESDDEGGDTQEQSAEKSERDLSNRPSHYETMHADICVVHDCDIEKLAAMGLEFLRYTRPVDQIDRISAIRQDRYLYVWVRDKYGNEFPFFIPKQEDETSRRCIFANESEYDYPKIVSHTSATPNMLSDLAVNRFQYALSSGREMYRMVNEKLKISQQTILNWLTRGGELLAELLPYIKRRLLTPNTVLYCDETWVETKVKGDDGKFHYVKRYMWVIVNLTTHMCYYLYGSRKKSVIQQFLSDFKGTLMTDAYAAYSYFGKIKDCMHVCCWAHVRRIFVSALRDYNDQLAKMFIDLISTLYKVEVESILLHRTEDEIVKARKIEAIPALAELSQKGKDILEKADSKQIKISSKLHQALAYMLNNWKELIGYVQIGNVLIDNNVCERAVRPFTNLRKSFGGFSSERGAQTAARYLTFVETCKLIKKPPLDFFRDFFNRIIQGKRDYELMAQELLLC